MGFVVDDDCTAHVNVFTSDIGVIEKFGGRIHYITPLFFPCFVHLYTVPVVIIQCRANIKDG